MRLHHIYPDYQDRVRLRVRPYPLEAMGGEAAPRGVLEQEWWLAAIQEPRAEFKPWNGASWPTTTLPAFEAARCAALQDETRFLDYDLRIRRAFFAESRDIGNPRVLLEVAQEAGLDVDRLTRDLGRGTARAELLAEAKLGQERYRVRGTPTVMLGDGTKLRHPIAFPRMDGDCVVGVMPLPCHGDGCLDATRALLERAGQQPR
ncbi:MAG: DsbA family protein [Chloroflexi bacterium]|nr:DsbA family protein [Chloroflexota bacterium]